MAKSDETSMIPRVWVVFSIVAALLMALTSAAGAFLGGTYARETASWAAQARGQDVVNLFVICPLLFVSAYFVLAGSLRGVLGWLGALMYTVYSYVLYALCAHFNAWFLLYVATLGLSAFAFVGACMALARQDLAGRFGEPRRHAAASIFLLTFGALFAMLWLSEIVPALMEGRVPPSAVDAGLPVNPVHVLDLAFILPGMMATAVALWRRRPMGLLFAVPMLVFSFTMGLAVIAMAWMMRANGVPFDAALVSIIGLVVVISGVLIRGLLYGAVRQSHDVS